MLLICCIFPLVCLEGNRIEAQPEMLDDVVIGGSPVANIEDFLENGASIEEDNTVMFDFSVSIDIFALKAD